MKKPDRKKVRIWRFRGRSHPMTKLELCKVLHWPATIAILKKANLFDLFLEIHPNDIPGEPLKPLVDGGEYNYELFREELVTNFYEIFIGKRKARGSVVLR